MVKRLIWRSEFKLLNYSYKISYQLFVTDDPSEDHTEMIQVWIEK